MSMSADEARRIDALFHRLWTKAVGASDYDKGQWMELEIALYTMFKNLGVPDGWGRPVAKKKAPEPPALTHQPFAKLGKGDKP